MSTIKTTETHSIYTHPELAAWMDGFEGIPDRAPTRVSCPRGGRERVHLFMDDLARILPGLAFASGLAILSAMLTDWIAVSLLGFAKSPVSPILIAIILGIVIHNTIGLPVSYVSGFRFCVKRILRIGIALLGIRLSLSAAGEIGLIAIPIVVVCIASALIFVTRVNRALGLPPRLGALIAVGTSICGVSAIVAAAPSIDAEDDEISYAVACVSLFGMVALLAYPFVAHGVFGGDSEMAGLFMGTAIHDTSQVAGAGLIYQEHYNDPAALNTAVVTKLVRNLCMIGVIPLMAMLYQRSREEGDRTATPAWYRMVPLFVLGFVAMTLVRTVGDLGEAPMFGLLDEATWKSVVDGAKSVAEWCLIVAMASVGLSTNIGRIMKLGWRPFSIGMVAAVLVGAVSIAMIKAVNAVL